MQILKDNNLILKNSLLQWPDQLESNFHINFESDQNNSDKNSMDSVAQQLYLKLKEKLENSESSNKINLKKKEMIKSGNDEE